MTTVVTIDQEGRYHRGKGLLQVPFIIRGEVVDNYALEIEGRDRGAGKITFQTPDLQSYLKTLVKVDTNDLEELANIPCKEIIDLLHQVGRAFEPATKENGF